MRIFSRSFWKTLAWTYAAQVAASAGVFLAPAIVARLGNMEDLGRYLLVQRLASSCVAPLTLGLAVALGRLLPLNKGKPGMEARWSLVSFAIVGLVATLFMVALWVQRTFYAGILFGTSAASTLVFPFALLASANALQAVVYGYYRGCLRIGWANCLQAVTVGVVPVVAMLQMKRIGLISAIMLMGYMTSAIVVLFASPALRAIFRTTEDRGGPWLQDASKVLLSYGLGRVPGFIFVGLLLATGPVWLAHYGSMTDVAMYALGLSALRMGAAFFAPVGILTLPLLASAFGTGLSRGVRDDLSLLLRFSVIMTLLGSLQVATLSRTLLQVWLGSTSVGGRGFFVLLVLAAPTYLTFEILRDPIDAASAFPYNTFILGLALCAFAVGAVTRTSAGLVIGQLAGFLLLGGASVAVARRLYQFTPGKLRSWLDGILFCVLPVPFTWLMQRQFDGRLAILAVFELLLLAAFLMFIGRVWKRDSGSGVPP